jgi:hypothetical protein
MRKTLAAAAFALSLCDTQAHAVTGVELATECQTPGDVQGISHCLGFIRGVGDTLTFWQMVYPKSANPKSVYGCMPVTVTATQLRDAWLKWIKENPKFQNESAAIWLALAFKDAWPCDLR